MTNIRRPKEKSKSESVAKDPTFERTRKRLEKKRILREREMKRVHYWNLCPKCGGDMFEQKSLHIYFDVCRECRGIYIDAPELDLARKHIDPKKLLSALSKKAKKPKLPH